MSILVIPFLIALAASLILRLNRSMCVRGPSPHDAAIALTPSRPHRQRFEPLPLIGHAPWVVFLRRQNLLRWLARGTEWHKGRTWALQVPSLGTAWVIEDPSHVKHVLATRHDAFAKGDFAGDKMRGLFGDGIVVAEGPSWKTQRTAGSAAFARPSNLAFFAEQVLPRHLDVLLEPFERAAEGAEKNAGAAATLDVQPVAEKYAMAVFGELAYDSNFTRLSAHFSGPFTRAAVTTDARFVNPLWRVTERISGAATRFAADVREVKRFGRDLVEEMRSGEKMPLGGSGGGEDEEDAEEDMRGLLLRELVKAHGDAEDTQFLADACLNFLTAGKDTTAQAVSWTIYRLLLHPTHIPILRHELSLHRSRGESLTHSALTSPTGPFPRTNAFISEVLRLHPPVPLELLQNVSDEAVALPAGGTAEGNVVHVKPKELVMWSPWAMGRSERIWGPTAAEFRPERWLADDPVDKAGPSSDAGKNTSTITALRHPSQKTAYEFPVFHGGPRSCLGKPLARAEIAYSVLRIVEKYDLTPAWDTTIEKTMGDGLLAPVRDGLPVRVKRRRVRA